MQAFATLLDRLSHTASRNAKLSLISEYLATTPDPDRGWALAALAGDLEILLPIRRLLRSLLDGRVDPVLYQLSRDYVGDTAETVALLWPEKRADNTTPEALSAPPVSEVVETIRGADRYNIPELLASWLDNLDTTGRWALLKLLTGGLRVGVSARLAKQAAADFSGKSVSEIEEIWHGVSAPYEALFAWLENKADIPDISGIPVFRPMMLANPLEDALRDTLDISAFAAEWKWDGIRVQLVSVNGDVRLYSRTGDDIGKAFPDIVRSLSQNVVLDGELLVKRGTNVAPFNDLQQRLNRKSVSPRLLREFPAHIRVYDLLREGDEDLRSFPWQERQRRLASWIAANPNPRLDLSEILETPTLEVLEQFWSQTRNTGIEGLMLKRKDSPYLAGRPKGHWFKWKRAPLVLDVVLMYAERGSGKRSSFYSDYTFGVWQADADGREELVPVGKAYSGFTDKELKQLDKWIRGNTLHRYGPVRSVPPGIVFEVAFDAVHRSSRHKSGVAMRFPRIHRIRWDKPVEEADQLETVMTLIEQNRDPLARGRSEPDEPTQLSLF